MAEALKSEEEEDEEREENIIKEDKDDIKMIILSILRKRQKLKTYEEDTRAEDARKKGHGVRERLD